MHVQKQEIHREGRCLKTSFIMANYMEVLGPFSFWGKGAWQPVLRVLTLNHEESKFPHQVTLYRASEKRKVQNNRSLKCVSPFSAHEYDVLYSCWTLKEVPINLNIDTELENLITTNHTHWGGVRVECFMPTLRQPVEKMNQTDRHRQTPTPLVGGMKLSCFLWVSEVSNFIICRDNLWLANRYTNLPSTVSLYFWSCPQPLHFFLILHLKYAHQKSLFEEMEKLCFKVARIILKFSVIQNSFRKLLGDRNAEWWWCTFPVHAFWNNESQMQRSSCIYFISQNLMQNSTLYYPLKSTERMRWISRKHITELKASG